MKTLNLNIEDFYSFLTKYRLESDEPIEHPWLDDRVQSFINDTKVKNFIEELLSNERVKLKSYLANNGFGLNRNTCVVDIGWRGSIQDNLAYLHPDITIHGFYLGLQKFLNEQPSNTKKKGGL